MKFLVIVVLCLIVGTWLARATGARSGGRRRNAAEPESGSEAMVRCLHCGVFFPRSEAIVNPAGLSFCSEDHQRQHVSR